MIQFKSLQNEKSKWEVAYRYTEGTLAEVDYAFEADSPSFDTFEECEQEIKRIKNEQYMDESAHRQYMYGVEYACGIRD